MKKKQRASKFENFGLRKNSKKKSDQKYWMKSSENDKNHEKEVYEMFIKIGAKNYFVKNSEIGPIQKR